MEVVLKSVVAFLIYGVCLLHVVGELGLLANGDGLSMSKVYGCQDGIV